jgi:hypothetical protein
VQVVDGVVPGSFGPMAEELLASQPLIAALCACSAQAQPIPQSLTRMKLYDAGAIAAHGLCPVPG